MLAYDLLKNTKKLKKYRSLYIAFIREYLYSWVFLKQIVQFQVHLPAAPELLKELGFRVEG